MSDETRLRRLMDRVRSHPKYRAIMSELVQSLVEEAIGKGLKDKAVVKAVRNKLHQIGGSYFKHGVDYTNAEAELAVLLEDIHSSEVKRYCLEQMKAHTSTTERIAIIDTFFHTTLASIAPITGVLDLACGFNPLAIPWMPMADGCTYHACDIYLDMLEFNQSFFNHFGIQGHAFPCNLVKDIPRERAQVAFFLKSLPCLEQLDKSIGARLFEEIRSDHILVSFPVHSLGGMNKGMPTFYSDHFHALTAGKNWSIQTFHFETELAFLISK